MYAHSSYYYWSISMIRALVDYDGCRFGQHCCWRAGNVIIKIEVDRKEFITTLIYDLLLYFFIRNLDQHLGRVSRALYSVEPSTPRRWRGERFGPHGCSVCDSFCVLWLLLHRLKFVVCEKKVPKNLRDKVNDVTLCSTLACTTPPAYQLFGHKHNSDDEV